MKTYYDLLGVSLNATTTEINEAYKKLSVLFHPDKGATPNNKAFQLIKAVHGILSNEDALYALSYSLKKPDIFEPNTIYIFQAKVQVNRKRVCCTLYDMKNNMDEEDSAENRIGLNNDGTNRLDLSQTEQQQIANIFSGQYQPTLQSDSTKAIFQKIANGNRVQECRTMYDQMRAWEWAALPSNYPNQEEVNQLCEELPKLRKQVENCLLDKNAQKERECLARNIAQLSSIDVPQISQKIHAMLGNTKNEPDIRRLFGWMISLDDPSVTTPSSSLLIVPDDVKAIFKATKELALAIGTKNEGSSAEIRTLLENEKKRLKKIKNTELSQAIIDVIIPLFASKKSSFFSWSSEKKSAATKPIILYTPPNNDTEENIQSSSSNIVNNNPAIVTTTSSTTKEQPTFAKQWKTAKNDQGNQATEWREKLLSNIGFNEIQTLLTNESSIQESIHPAINNILTAYLKKLQELDSSHDIEETTRSDAKKLADILLNMSTNPQYNQSINNLITTLIRPDNCHQSFIQVLYKNLIDYFLELQIQDDEDNTSERTPSHIDNTLDTLGKNLFVNNANMQSFFVKMAGMDNIFSQCRAIILEKPLSPELLYDLSNESNQLALNNSIKHLISKNDIGAFEHLIIELLIHFKNDLEKIKQIITSLTTVTGFRQTQTYQPFRDKLNLANNYIKIKTANSNIAFFSSDEAKNILSSLEKTNNVEIFEIKAQFLQKITPEDYVQYLEKALRETDAENKTSIKHINEKIITACQDKKVLFQLHEKWTHSKASNDDRAMWDNLQRLLQLNVRVSLSTPKNSNTIVPEPSKPLVTLTHDESHYLANSEADHAFERKYAEKYPSKLDSWWNGRRERIAHYWGESKMPMFLRVLGSWLWSGRPEPTTGIKINLAFSQRVKETSGNAGQNLYEWKQWENTNAVVNSISHNTTLSIVSGLGGDIHRQGSGNTDTYENNNKNEEVVRINQSNSYNQGYKSVGSDSTVGENTYNDQRINSID